MLPMTSEIKQNEITWVAAIGCLSSWIFCLYSSIVWCFKINYSQIIYAMSKPFTIIEIVNKWGIFYFFQI